VKTGIVERRQVQDEIRTVGNVEADETRLAVVQVRFSGWVQKVYANHAMKSVCIVCSLDQTPKGTARTSQ
jgi:hypothetical protein